MSIKNFPEGEFAVITPYLLPPGPKRVNVGDGFILDSAIRLLGLRPRYVFSSRAPLTAADIEQINSTRLLLVVGANSLKDDFEITPGFSLQTLDALQVPVVLMGVGHYGTLQQTRGLSSSSTRLLRALLERFPHLSVRCDASWRYVANALPDCAESIVMTSCPVVHAVDGIDAGFVARDVVDQLVVTVTDRHDIESQWAIIRAAALSFTALRSVLALHQDFGHERLWRAAEGLGFEVLRSTDCEDFLALYRATDLHFGNRVHAHLKCLSLGVRSFCTPFDLRQTYFAESLGFPLITNVPDPAMDAYDFGEFARRRDALRLVMNEFVDAVRAVILTHRAQ